MNSTPAKPAQAQGSISEGEGTLVAQAKAGDVQAFEDLVNRYERKIFRLAMNITQNKEDAEDVMQEAFLKAYAHLKDFQGDSRFYTWLVRITVNEGLMRLRKRRPGVVSLDEKIETEDDLVVRELEDFRMLAFGGLMVLIMIWRPRGLLAFRDPTIRLRPRREAAAPPGERRG